MVRQLFEANRQPPQAALAAMEPLLAPDFEFLPHMATVEGNTYRGPGALVTWRADMLDAFESVVPEADEFRDLGDHVLVSGHTLLQGKASGAGSQFEWVQVYSVRDGRIASCRVYRDEQTALEAVGLRE